MSPDRLAAPASSLTDPVCGMAVTVLSSHVLQHEGKAFYFCSFGCKAKFAAEPAKYLKPPPGAAAVAPVPDAAAIAPTAAALYTCPMHPEIQQARPGACPKCGMALEPLMPSLDEGENHELVDFKRRFWWSLPLTVVVAALAMLGHRLQWFDMATQSWIELLLTLPIVLWAGWPFFVRGAQSIMLRVRPGEKVPVDGVVAG